MGEKIYKYILWLGLAAILIFSPIGLGGMRVWSITPILLVEELLIFLWLFKVVNAKTPYKLRRTKIDIPIVAFAALAVISFVFSIYKHDSFYALLRLFGYIGVFYVVVNEFGRSMRRGLVYLVISIGSALSLFGLLQYFGPLGHSWWYPQNFLAATYVNHNHFAGYLELVIPVSLAMLMAKGNQSQDIGQRATTFSRLLLILALVLMIAAFILTESRGAWASLGIALLVMFDVMFRREGRDKKRVFTLILMTVALIAIAYFGKDIISERLETIADTEIGDMSFESRTKIWQGSIAMIKDNPLIGTGIGTFVWGFPRYRPEGLYARAHYAHNDYVHMAAEMGLAGAVIMIWILTLIIKEGFSGKNQSPYIIGCAAGCLSLSLHGLIDFNFHIPANMLLFVVWAAFVMRESSR